MPTSTALKMAPALDLPGAEGSRYALREALGRGPVLLGFFKVSCPTCQYAFPFIERIHQQLGRSGAQVWGVSQDSAADTRRFATEFGVSFPLLIDEKPYDASRRYGVHFTPTLFLVTPDGQVALASDGFVKSDLLEIQKWLGKHYSVAPPALFLPQERVPEFKPG
ncbi:MAG TPA: TlpA disulfide reductase family protein [Terriglobia bacterium]|nr:TlpA disulfide reductase family protein [Terriglobia bacterium]